MYILLFLAAIMSAQTRQNNTPVIELHVPPVLGSLEPAFHRAHTVVRDAFSEFGLKVEWRMAGASAPGCSKKPLIATIQVALAWQTPSGVSSEALAVSNPNQTGGACITLLMDRLKQQSMRNPVTTGYLLGYVLAHEIGHVLQGIARHSETGILEQHWGQAEIRDMWRPRSLRFTSHDIDLIVQGMQAPPLLPKLY